MNICFSLEVASFKGGTMIDSPFKRCYGLFFNQGSDTYLYIYDVYIYIYIYLA